MPNLDFDVTKRSNAGHQVLLPTSSDVFLFSVNACINGCLLAVKL